MGNENINVPGFTPVRNQVNVEAAVKYIQGLNIHGFKANGIHVLQANNGMSNPTYLIWSDGGRKIIIRKKPTGKLLPGAHQIEREYR